MKLACNTCGHAAEGQIDEPCRFYTRRFERCPGKYRRATFLVFDLRLGKYHTRDKSLAVLEEYAGRFDEAGLNELLVAQYGTADRRQLQTRITILVR